MDGAKIGPEDMPQLLKQVQVVLGLDPAAVDPAAPGNDSLRRQFGSLAQVVAAVTELRNRLARISAGKGCPSGRQPPK
jgi:hypothetical protein